MNEWWVPLLQMGLIVLMRVTSVFLSSPIFASRTIPTFARAALSLVLTLTLLPIVTIPASPIPVGRFLLLMVTQIAVGALQGLLFSALLMGVQMVGDLFDMTVGISMASVIDPTDSTSHAIFGRLFGALGWVTFLILDGHLVLLSCVIDSLRMLPPDTPHLSHQLVAVALTQLAGATSLAWRLGAPLLGLLLLVDVLTGVLSRTVPQLQVMQFSFGAKQMVALLALALFLGGLSDVFARQVLDLQRMLRGS